MISLKSDRELELMRQAGRVTAGARRVAGQMIEPGVTTGEIDKAVRKFIKSQGATASFLGLYGFPGAACISVNEEVIHGIPGHRRLREGDIVSVDVGACLAGYHGDCAATFPCGKISREAARLIEVTRESFFAGIQHAQAGNRLYDISHAVQVYVEKNGCSVVRDYVGHGVGAKVHEAPEVPNFGPAGHGVRLQPGMVLAVEPMVNLGDWPVRTLSNEWTVVTRDGSLSAHFENTVAITPDGPEILTQWEGRTDGT